MVCPHSAALNSGAEVALVRYIAPRTLPAQRVRASTNPSHSGSQRGPAEAEDVWKRADLAPGREQCYNTCMNELKVTKIGNSAGVVLPKDLLAHLHVAIGQTLSVTKTSQGIELRPPSADFDAQMAKAREVMARRRRALRELAK